MPGPARVSGRGGTARRSDAGLVENGAGAVPLGHGAHRLAVDDPEDAAVVVEAEWSEVLGSPPPHTQLTPKTVYRSVIAWQQRYPSIHWWFCADRRLAEVTTFRILERWWLKHGEGAQ